MEKKVLFNLFYILLGSILVIAGCIEMVDSFYSGMGGALIGVGIIRLLQYIRYRNNEDYRENYETELHDERNRFLRNKAWAWSGYLFTMIMASATIIFKLMDETLLSFAASWAVCLLLVLYWICYVVLKKKY